MNPHGPVTQCHLTLQAKPAARRGTDCPACYVPLGRLQAGMTYNTRNSCNSRNTSAPQDAPTNAAQEHTPGGRGLMPDESLGVEGEEVAGLDEWGDPECVAMPMRRAASCCCSVRGEFTCEQSAGPSAGTGVEMLVQPKRLSKRELCERAPRKHTGVARLKSHCRTQPTCLLGKTRRRVSVRREA